MPQYLMSVHGPAERGERSGFASKQDMLQAFADTGKFNDRLQEDGYFVFAGGLEPAGTATVVDGQGDQPVITDGPNWSRRNTSGLLGSLTSLTWTWRCGWLRRGRRPAGARSRSGPSRLTFQTEESAEGLPEP